MDALFSVGWNKCEMDFAVRGDLMDLTLDEMNEFRKMLVAGIGTAEDMWRREQQRKHPSAVTKIVYLTPRSSIRSGKAEDTP